jgi:hypothetical protein
MPSSLKIKKKPQTLNKATSDSQLPKTLTSTQKLLFSNRADLEHSDQGRDLLQTMRSPHKASHFLNLQIPSLNPSALPSSKTMIKSKLVSSKTLKSPRATSLKKKKQAEPESFKTPTEDQEQHKSDKMILEDMNEEARVLEKELQKALDENKRLKSKMQVVRVSDEQIDDLMKNFKNRLQKVLFEAV